MSIARRLISPISIAVVLAMQCPTPAVTQATTNLPFGVVPMVGHTNDIVSTAFSADGRTLASRSDKVIKLWDVATGRLLRTLSDQTFTAPAFSPDGTLLAVGTFNSIKLWEVASGHIIRTFEGHTDSVRSVAFSPDGHNLVSGGNDGTIRLWNVSTAQLLRKTEYKSDWIGSVAFSPNGKLIAANSDDKTTRLLDASSGRLIRSFETHAQSIAFAPDGSSLASWTFVRENTIKLWDIATGTLIRTLEGHTDAVTGVAFSPDGRTVASASRDNTVRLWDAISGKPLRTLAGRSGTINSVSFSPDGQMIASGGYSLIEMWDLRGASARTLKIWDQAALLANSVESLAVSSDDQLLAIGRYRTVELWDAQAGRLLRIFDAPPGRVTALSLSPNKEVLASSSGDNIIKLWDAGSSRPLRTLEGHGGPVLSLVFSPDNRVLASGGGDKTIKLWTVATGQLLATITGHAYDVGTVAFSPDGHTLASGSNDSSIKLWDPDSGKLLRTLTGHTNSVRSLAFSPDGRTLASGSVDGHVKVWDARTGRLLRTFGNQLEAIINSVAFSPDGRTVLSGERSPAVIASRNANEAALIRSQGGQPVVEVWDAAAGGLLRKLMGHSDPIKAVAFSGGGRTIVSASDDGTVKFWKTDTGELLATLICNRSREWVAITPEGFFDSSENGSATLSVVRGLDVWSIDQFYQALYRPDLVREKLAGDPRGLVREAAAKLDLDKVLTSGEAPTVTIVSPRDRSRATGAEVTAEVDISSRAGGIGRVEWHVNGVTVGVEDRSAAGAPSTPLRFSRGLVLDEGDNEIEVVAYNSRNLIASTPARASVTGPAPATRVPPRLFVLAVGLNDYADPNIRLKFAVPDAQALADAFTKAGKGLYESVDVTLLRDAQVTRSGLDAAFAALAGKVRATDVFVFFAAGHGKTVDGRYYFIPQDFQLAGIESVLAKGIPQEQWQQWFAKVAAKRSLMLFDTCESASLTGEGKETRALEEGAASARLVQATGRSIMTAATGDALEGYRGHGLFTYNLIEALGRADSDGDGKIALTELATYVYAEVTALSDRVFKEHQEPQIRISGTDYALANTTDLLSGAAPGIAIAIKPTHLLAAGADIVVQPNIGARRVRKLDAQTPVTLVRTEGGWDLVARNGNPLGYVAASGLAQIQ